jgi:transposase
MNTGLEASPDDIDALKAALIAARAEVAIVRAQQSDDQALIAYLKLQIEKLNPNAMALARSAPRGCWISSN